jgi:glycosyltransferase involved in cell wall biosynthesis
MQQEPLFSVVIPTRNRAHLLRNAIQSVLWQDFDDYELIVSDNCSADNTAEVVREVGGSRARLVRPDRPLSMPDHWEFALDHARGRYVGYLCDDDAWAPDALRRVSQVLASSGAQLVVLSSGLYYAPNWLDPKLRNVASFPGYSGTVREHSSSETIRVLFNTCSVVNEVPRMLNSFCHRETMLRVRAAAGKIFVLCPDYSFAVNVLTEIPKWLYVDELLHVQGVFPEGIGSTSIYNRGDAGREYIREFKEEQLLRRVPLKSALVSNFITETLLICKETLPMLAGYEVYWVQYFVSCWTDMMVLKRNGVDVTADREEFFRVLAEQPASVRERVNVVVNCPDGQDPLDEWARRHPVRASVRKAINSSASLTKLESLMRGQGSNRQHRSLDGEAYVLVSGEAAGFADILECARQLPMFGIQAAAATATSKKHVRAGHEA